MLAAVRAIVFGPLIARASGHRAAGVRRLEQMAPGLIPALEATVGDHTPHGCAAALRASVTLYRQLRGDTSAPLRSRRGCQSLALGSHQCRSEYVGPHSSAPHAPGASQYSSLPRQPAAAPPGLTATMPHRSGQDRNDVTS